MTVCLFLSFAHRDRPEARLGAAEPARFAAIVAGAPGLQEAVILTPEAATDPFLNDGPPPLLAAQLYFPEIGALEAAAARNGALQALAAPGAFPTLDGAEARQQAMVVRSFPVSGAPPTGTPCTYLVGYDGAAEDPAAWLAHYLAHHVPMMVRLPGLRALEVYTRLDWCGALPWPRADYLQRNKVVFDDPAALTAALHSPVRQEMRADFHALPPFRGIVHHHPFETRVLRPARG